MGFEIVWTNKAIATFADRLIYLENYWTEKEIFSFTARVTEFLDILKEQPTMFRKSEHLKDPHIGLIIKEVSLVYRVRKIAVK